MWLGIGKASMYDGQEMNSSIFPKESSLTSYLKFDLACFAFKEGCSNRQNQLRDSSTTALPSCFNKDTPFIYLAFYSDPRNALNQDLSHKNTWFGYELCAPLKLPDTLW